jgi:hypothetical protein
VSRGLGDVYKRQAASRTAKFRPAKALKDAVK